MLVYTCVFAALLTVLFDLSRIAALGAIFYLLMDMAIHWGVLRRLRHEVQARAWILITAIALDALALGAFLWVKWQQDASILWWAAGGVAAIFAMERLFLRTHEFSHGEDPNYRNPGATESNHDH
jgi:hypothetical protein